jgi:hypothetical protein
MLRRIVCFLLLGGVAMGADFKVSSSHTNPSGAPSVNTRYYQGPRSRQDWRSSAGWRARPNSEETFTYGPRMARIYQCDMRRVLELDLDHRQYTAQELDQNGLPAGWQAEIRTTPVRQSGGRVHVSYSIRDTGERREMFGHTARHLIIKRTQTAQPGACATSDQTVQDGWFIDFEEPQGDCRPPQPKDAQAVLVSGDCQDKYSFDGPEPSSAGYPLELTTTTKLEEKTPKGVRTMTHSDSMKVTEFSTAPLDAALFELPTGFKHVDKLNDQPSPPLMYRARTIWENTKRTVKGWWPW